jgi:hypothetical protein
MRATPETKHGWQRLGRLDVQSAVVTYLESLTRPSTRQRRALERAREGTWAEDDEVSAAAVALGVRILVYERNNDARIEFGDDRTGESDAPTIALYNNGVHYDALVPARRDVAPSKQLM